MFKVLKYFWGRQCLSYIPIYKLATTDESKILRSKKIKVVTPMKNVGSGSKTTILSYSQVNLGMYFSKKMFSNHSETFLSIFAQNFIS